MSRKRKRRTRRRQTKRVEEKRVREPCLHPDMALTVWSAGNFLRVSVGENLIQMPGIWKGHQILVKASALRYWGLDHQEEICKEDRMLLMQMMEQLSEASPWMQIHFVDEQERRVCEPKWKWRRKKGHHL